MKNRWTRKTPRQSRAQFTYNAILEAARQVISNGDGHTTHHIAERAGVSVGSFYQYFKNKRAVLEELGGQVLQDTATAAISLALKALKTPHGPQALEKVVRQTADQWRHPVTGRLLRMSLQAGYREPLHTYLNLIDQAMRPMVYGRDEMKAPEMAITVIIHAFHGALEHAAMHSDWMEDEVKYEALVQELCVMGYGYLTADRAQWAKLRDAEKPPAAGSPWVVPTADDAAQKEAG